MTDLLQTAALVLKDPPALEALIEDLKQQNKALDSRDQSNGEVVIPFEPWQPTATPPPVPLGALQSEAPPAVAPHASQLACQAPCQASLVIAAIAHNPPMPFYQADVGAVRPDPLAQAAPTAGLPGASGVPTAAHAQCLHVGPTTSASVLPGFSGRPVAPGYHQPYAVGSMLPGQGGLPQPPQPPQPEQQQRLDLEEEARRVQHQRAALAVDLGLDGDKNKPDEIVKHIGRTLLAIQQGRKPAWVEMVQSFPIIAEPQLQFAFFTLYPGLKNNLTKFNSWGSGRTALPVGEGCYVTSVNGKRCTCGHTYHSKRCKQHEYHSVMIYFLLYDKEQEGEKQNQLKDSRLWALRTLRAALLHVQPLSPPVQPPEPGTAPAPERNGDAGGGAAGPSAALKRPCPPQISQTWQELEHQRPQKQQQQQQQQQDAAVGRQALPQEAPLPPPKSPTAAAPAAVPDDTRARDLTLAVRGNPLAQELTEPWHGALEAVVTLLQRCDSALSFAHLVFHTPAEFLLQMRCPGDGQTLAHLLVTPPRLLLNEDLVSEPPSDPDEGLPESEALTMIWFLITRLQQQLGAEAGLQAWRQLLEQRDVRHGANALHRAGRYGHRLKVLEQGVLPFASRSALLVTTWHLYTCCHSAYRTSHKAAGDLLVDHICQALLELCADTQHALRVDGVLGRPGPGGPVHTLLADVLYTLKNKFFRGQNDPSEGFKAPQGLSGHELLTAKCEEILGKRAAEAARLGGGSGAAAAGAAAAARDALMAGPALPLPSPSPKKEKKMFQMGMLQALVKLVDVERPRPLPQIDFTVSLSPHPGGRQ